MDNESGQLEERVRRLEQVVAELLERENSLHQRESFALPPQEAPAWVGQGDEPEVDSNAYLALVGRTFIVLGGAFLLRAVTESGQVPRSIGVLCGFGYALVWLIAATRAAREQALSASFHGSTAVIIAFPLLWESANRFDLLGPPAAAAALVLVTSLALGVAWHGRLAPVAMLAMLSAVGFGLALLLSTQQSIPFTIMLVMVGAATLWISYVRRWSWLPWVPALVGDAVVTSLALKLLSGDPTLPAMAVIPLQFGLLGVYLGTCTFDIYLRQRSVGPFEIVQVAAGVAIGLIGAAVVSHHSGWGTIVVGMTGLGLGMASYVAALAYLRGRVAITANFHFYASLGVVGMLVGGMSMLPSDLAAIAYTAMSLATAMAAWRLRQPTLFLHSLIYILVAAFTCGWLAEIAAAFVIAPAGAWPGLPLSAWLVLAAIAKLALSNRRPQAEAPLWAHMPQAFMLLLLMLAVSAVVVAHLAPMLVGTPADSGALATLRTVVLAVAAVLLAVVRYRDRSAVPAWLIYAIHGTVGLKLIVEDLRHSQPATLFVALGVFGVALIITARLVRRPASRPLTDDPHGQSNQGAQPHDTLP